MDSLESDQDHLRAGEGSVRLDLRLRQMSLLWWVSAWAFSCLLNFATDPPRAWMGDLASYAAGGGAAAAWSLLLTGWLSRPRHRRKVFGAGLGLAVLGALVSGSAATAAALASGPSALALKPDLMAIYQIGFDFEHYTVLFLAWYFIFLSLFSVERTTRIEEGVLRLRVLTLKAQDAALRERVRPEAWSEALAQVRAALARDEREEAEREVMALAEGLRTALGSYRDDAAAGKPPAGMHGGRFAGSDLAGAVDGEAPRFNGRIVNFRVVNRVFWAITFAILLLSLAPVYARSALRTKLFFFAYWLGFALVGYVCGQWLFRLWTVLGLQRELIRKAFAVVIVSAGAAFLSSYVSEVVAAVCRGGVMPGLQLVLSGLAYYFPIYIVWHCVYFYVDAIRRETVQRSLLAQTAEAAAAARNSMLRYQVRPHFLFNALNALFALIVDGACDRARAMTEALSAYIERSFAEDAREFVPICEQAEALQTYLSIERVRFGDRLRIRVDIPERLARACAPSLILQPLIENAIKYAVAATAEPVDVEIAADRAGDALLLRVRDSGGDPEAPVAPGLGIGLRNVRARLAGHYGDRGSLRCDRLTPKGFIAEIRLPLELECTPCVA